MELEIHPFEKSGLGKAPFHFQNYSISKVGTSCQHCGTGIKQVFEIGSSDGNTFKVGSSCVEKTDPVLYKQIKKARSEFLNQLRNERREAGLANWKAERKAKEDNNLANFALSNPEILNFLVANKDENPFFESLFNSIKTFGKLTEKQEFAVKKSMEPKVESNYVGEVGKRQDFELEVLRISEFEGNWGWVFIYVMKDVSGNIFVRKGTGKIGIESQDATGQYFTSPGIGAKFILKGTIKAHSDYKGVKQTIIARVKVKEIKK